MSSPDYPRELDRILRPPEHLRTLADAILASPHDAPDSTAIGVLADHLSENGNPAGEALSRWVNRPEARLTTDDVEDGIAIVSRTGDRETGQLIHYTGTAGGHSVHWVTLLGPGYWANLNRGRPVSSSSGYKHVRHFVVAGE